jgi:hypothetical protein
MRRGLVIEIGETRYLCVVVDDSNGTTEVVAATDFMATDPLDKASIIVGKLNVNSLELAIPLPATDAAPLRAEDGPQDLDEVGLDELVEAIVILTLDDPEDPTYWLRFVDLTTVVFGLEGRTEYLWMAIEQAGTRILPFMKAMEVPSEIGAGFAAIADRHRRIEIVMLQVRDIQRQFFRGLLLDLDPDLVFRSTTKQRLSSLGLGEPQSFEDWY